MSDDGTVAVERLTAERPESLPRRVAGPILTPLGQYDPIVWEGVNTSGLEPIGDSVLLLPDQPSAKTTGGIELPDELIERMAQAAETGVIVAVGDGAWAWNADRTRAYGGTKPAVGQRVWFERYSGSLPHGVDGRIYRLITDRQIAAKAIALLPSIEVEAPPVEPIVVKPVEAPPVEEPRPRWPQYLHIHGSTMLAFNEADAQDKAPGERWYPTADAAVAAAGAA